MVCAGRSMIDHSNNISDTVKVTSIHAYFPGCNAMSKNVNDTRHESNDGAETDVVVKVGQSTTAVDDQWTVHPDDVAE